MKLNELYTLKEGETRWTDGANIQMSIDDEFSHDETSLQPLVQALYQAGYKGRSSQPNYWSLTDLVPDAEEGSDFEFAISHGDDVPTVLTIMNHDIVNDRRLTGVLSHFEGPNYHMQDEDEYDDEDEY